MPTIPTKVKGIKYGTMARYLALATKDPDTLYFVYVHDYQQHCHQSAHHHVIGRLCKGLDHSVVELSCIYLGENHRYEA